MQLSFYFALYVKGGDSYSLRRKQVQCSVTLRMSLCAILPGLIYQSVREIGKVFYHKRQ